MLLFSLSFLVCSCFSSVSPIVGEDVYYTGIGDRLAHGPVSLFDTALGKLRSLPVTTSQATTGFHIHADDDDDDDDVNQAKWAPLADHLATELLGQSGCHPRLGTPYVRLVDGAADLSEDHPQIMFFGETGRIVGSGAVMFSFAESTENDWLSPHGYVPTSIAGRQVKLLTVTYLEEPCSSDPTFPNIVQDVHKSTIVPLGDRLIVSNHDDAQRRAMPVTLDDALAAGFVQGSCFEKMGQHFALFLDDAGNVLSEPNYKAKSLFPVVLMYGGGVLSTYFFTIPEPQFSHASRLAVDTNSWDVAAFSPSLFCKNFCDEDCTFDNDYFSTMHHYLRDVSEVSCSVSTIVRGSPDHRAFAGKMSRLAYTTHDGVEYTEMWSECGTACCQKNSNGDKRAYYQPNIGELEDLQKNAHKFFGMPAGDPTPYFGVSIMSGREPEGAPVFRTADDETSGDSSATLTVVSAVLGVLLALTCCCAAGLAGLLVMSRARASQGHAPGATSAGAHGRSFKRSSSRHLNGRA